MAMLKNGTQDADEKNSIRTQKTSACTQDLQSMVIVTRRANRKAKDSESNKTNAIDQIDSKIDWQTCNDTLKIE